MVQVNYGLLDVITGGISTVSDIFENAGAWCVDIINAAYTAFFNLVFSAFSILSEDIDAEIFSDFWAVINPVNKVFCTIASTLMVLLFVYNFATDTWQVRHDVDVFDIAKSVIKLSFAVILVNNSLQVVKAIFNMGAVLARVIMPGDIGTNTVAIGGYEAKLIQNGVSGILGFIIFFVFLVAAFMIVFSAVQITLEIYERIFKIYILIPFSAISFSTFVLGDGNRGNDIFHGYMRSIITTAMDAVIIVLCICFTSMLVSGETLNKIFPAIHEENVKEITCEGEDEVYLLYLTVIEGWYVPADAVKDDISSGIYDFLYGKSGYLSTQQDYAKMSVDGRFINNSFFSLSKMNHGDSKYYVVLYPEFGWGNVIITLLKVIFPCLLCVGAVKKVSTFSGMIMGRG